MLLGDEGRREKWAAESPDQCLSEQEREIIECIQREGIQRDDWQLKGPMPKTERVDKYNKMFLITATLATACFHGRHKEEKIAHGEALVIDLQCCFSSLAMSNQQKQATNTNLC